MKNVLSALFILFVTLNLSGCSTTEKVLPLHDEVLTYELPYDLTYLRTLDAVQTQSRWQLEETDKEKGLIKIRNIHYNLWDDSDQRTLTFTIKRIDRAHTSVQLAPDSQRSVDAGDLLKVVDRMLSAEK